MLDTDANPAVNATSPTTNSTATFLTSMKMQILSGRGFQIRTGPAQALYEAVLRWIQCGMLGGMVYGQSRLGKTSAIRWVCKHLSDMFGFIRFIEVPIRTQKFYSETGFFEYLMQCCGLKEASSGQRATQRRNTLHQYILAQAERSPLRMVIIVFDEAQDIAHLNLKWIQNIANELETHGVRLFVLLVGQPELSELKTQSISVGAEHFVGRYMVCSHPFEGIRSEPQLAEVFAAYDATIFPPKGKRNPGALRVKDHFLSPDLAQRIDLQQLASSFWPAFENIWKLQKPSVQMEIPMHYVTSSLMFCLEDMSKLPADVTEIPTTLIKNSADLSGFRESVEMSAMRFARDAPKHAGGRR